MTSKKLMKKGFTLIEIVIVLAIAALIMVIVFLAVQGAQRAQRDTFRKDVANRVLAGLTSFEGNHGGLQTNDATLIAPYVTTLTANGVTITLESTGTVGSCSATAGSVAITNNTPDTVVACLEGDTTNYTTHN